MIYFISDAHLGSRVMADVHEHERKMVRWLEMVRKDATAIYLLGDMFDFWFEYKSVVPKGYVRFLGKLAELVDSGIEIHFFTGNHDIWTFGYLETEVGLIVHKSAYETVLGNKKFYMAHGDGLDMDDKKFRFVRKIFHSRFAQNLFGYFPPRWGQAFGYSWSESNRLKHLKRDNKYRGEDNEDLVIFAKKYSSAHEVDFLVFGHRHIVLDLQLSTKARIVVLGDFMYHFTYGVFDGENFHLDYFEAE